MTTRSELDLKFLAAIERLGRALRGARQEVATRLSVSLLQLQIIENIATLGPRRIGLLASELDVSQPTVSDALSTLEDKGLVRRIRDNEDGRAFIIELTAAGLDAASIAAASLAPIWNGSRSTSEDDQAAALVVILEEIRRLQHAGVISINRSCLSCNHYQPADSDPAECLLLKEILHPRDHRVDCPDHEPTPLTIS